MAKVGSEAVASYPRSKSWSLAACVLLVMLPACHGNVDYSLRDRHAVKGTPEYDSLAKMHYLSKGETDPYSIELKRDRARRGYGFNAPIHNDGEGIKSYFTVSRTKEFRWFSGMQLSFEF